MLERHHAIIIPGLGDDVRLTRFYVRNWGRRFGIEPHIHNAHWQDTEESFVDKLDRLIEEIDDLSSDEGIVSILGISAGGSLGFNGFNERRALVNKAISICGCLKFIEEYRSLRVRGDKYPAFRESVQTVRNRGTNLLHGNIRRVMSMVPIYDEIVPVSTAEIVGRTNQRMIAALHIPSIFIAFNFYSRAMADFILKPNGKNWRVAREKYLTKP